MEISPKERIYVENQFRKGETRILVSSDLLSRGFDVQDLALVINFDVPTANMSIETYIHRVGRTGRYGRKGIAISLVREDIPSETQLLEKINKQYNGKISNLPADIRDVFTHLGV